MDREMTQGRRRARWGLALVPLVLVLAGCSSGGGGSGAKATPSPDARLKSAGATVQSAMKSYLTAVTGCATQSSPVVCLEAADHTLGNAIHDYANVIATRHGFTAPRKDLTATLNEAQLLANSLEILGAAQPTQANYNQVLNTFNVNAAITELQGKVTTLGASLGK